MKIAIMMRAIDQDSGFHLFLDGLLEALLKFDRENEYLLLYRLPRHFGRFSSYPNATELILKAPHKLLWDQVAVPYAAWKHKADVIYNPKFTVPLISHCPVVMGLQEPAWYAWPQHYPKTNALYQQVMLPLYIRKASHFTAMTHWDFTETCKYIDLSAEDVTVAYPGVHQHLKRVTDTQALAAFRAKHCLPERFILSMTRVDNPGIEGDNKWNPSKNPHTTLKAFLLCRDKIPHHLVFAGRNVRPYMLANGFTEADFDRVHFIDFVPFDEIQFVYTLADLISVPSYYESFSFTLVGAMACGCPSIASASCGIGEVAGEGALYIEDPDSAADLADKMLMILSNDELRQRLAKRGLEMVSKYSWENAARDTLRSFQEGIRHKNGKARSARAGLEAPKG